MSGKHIGLGSEHRLCDRVQSTLIALFLVVLSVDTLGFYILGHSTVIATVLSAPLLSIPVALSMASGVYLLSKSHNLVLVKRTERPRFTESGVYSIVRHPMYLGTLLFCLAFIFMSISLLSMMVWLVLFFSYNKMTVFEEKDLVRILGKRYADYQRRVPKWIPRL